MSDQTDQHSLDIQIGQMIRAMRAAKGWSQEDLAQQVGLSFQQVQKYENGNSRILASKLFEFASVFDVDVSQFFRGLPHVIGDEPDIETSTVFAKDTWKLAAQFDRIEDKETRSKIMELVAILAKSS